MVVNDRTQRTVNLANQSIYVFTHLIVAIIIFITLFENKMALKDLLHTSYILKEK